MKMKCADVSMAPFNKSLTFFLNVNEAFDMNCNTAYIFAWSNKAHFAEVIIFYVTTSNVSFLLLLQLREFGKNINDKWRHKSNSKCYRLSKLSCM